MPRLLSRFLRQFSHSRPFRSLSIAVVTLLVLNLTFVFVTSISPAVVYAAPPKPTLPTNLSKDQAHPGAALVAFRTPVKVSGHKIGRGGDSNASDDELNALNKTLDGLGATSVKHLFSNIPAAALNDARAKAEADTGAFVTDFTQVYLIKFNPSINPGEAVNRLATSPLITSAMPDLVFRQPVHEKPILTQAQVQAALNAPRASVVSNMARMAGPAPTVNLPVNYSYKNDGQSYHDAASNNVTGAIAMLQSKFNQQPGQGTYITNISLGNIDDTSSVLENGQRYLEQAGYPKIPVWLSTSDCTVSSDGTQTCTVTLDPSATTLDNQGDLGEVMLDFSVMAPPPLGDKRVVNAPPAGLGEILGEAYGANFRLINPLENTTENFFGAFLGAAFLQTPKPSVITASIGTSFGIGGFSDYFFEQEGIIHDVVTLAVSGADIFVSISAGDGQTNTDAAMNPNGLTGPTDVTRNPAKITDIDDPNAWANPSYSYGLTVEPQYVIDSGANDAGGDTLNDVVNNAPWNRAINPKVSHSQHTTETRWTGQLSFHTGSGSRANISAPADNILYLAQVIDPATGKPVNPVATTPGLIGGTSASAPEIAGSAAVVRQTAALLGHPLTAKQTRKLLIETGRNNLTPYFDLSDANIGPNLDLTAAVQSLFDRYGGRNQTDPFFVRMTVAERKAVNSTTINNVIYDFGRNFYTDTPQDPLGKTAVIDLSQGLTSASGFSLEEIGQTGDNINAPITFGVDAAFLPLGKANFSWTLQLNNRRVEVPGEYYKRDLPYIRLLPAEIFGLLDKPLTASYDRVVVVTAKSGRATISMDVIFKGQSGATYSHAIPPTFNPVFQPDNNSDKVTFKYDLRGLRDANGKQVDGGILIVSDIDRTSPRAFTDRDPDVHGFKKTLNGLVGQITVSAAELPHGVGTYGIAIRGTSKGKEVTHSTSFWLPLRYAPKRYELPATPKIQAESSLWAFFTVPPVPKTAPLFYEIADTEANGGSTKFAVTYDVRNVTGAKNAVIEFSRPTYDFAGSLFFTGAFPDGRVVNNFTNPNGDRYDTGNNLGQAGSVARVPVQGTKGLAKLDGATIGLTIPDGKCDSTYQVRVLATDGQGKIVGVAGNGSILSYGDFSRDACFF